MDIVVDAREPLVMRRLLAENAVQVFVDRLDVGDYVVAPGCVVERKHVVDLHDSIVRGRFWPQLGRLRSGSDEQYLLVEGRSLAGPVHPDAIRGALLATGELGTA